MAGFFKKHYDYILLVVILVVALVMRLHLLGEISFSNDELSALTRARFDSYPELVEKGIKVDGHPLLVQTMIWYTIHHFNDDVFTVRFLFAIAGVLAIYFLFLLGKSWFGKATALLASAAMATLIFPLLYSQTARPYVIGLMFSMALAYFWTKILFDDRRRTLISIGYVLAAAGCVHSHYFSFLLAGIIGVTGLFYMRKDNYMNYLICNILVILLFVPTFGIFKQQIGYGGIGGWLPPPDGSFLFRFLWYVFNESLQVTVLFTGIFIASIIRYFKNSVPVAAGRKKYYLFSLLWFLLSFATGYLYSIFVSPVIQFSTLLFSFPFLLLFIFSFVNETWLPRSVVVVLTIVTLTTGVHSTVSEKKYYTTNHFGVFKELAEKIKEWDLKYGREKIEKIISISNPAYINYYFKRLDHDPHVDIYTDDERNEFARMAAMLDTTTADYVAYGWTNAIHFYETISLITEKFPVVVERDTFFNSEITLFGKGNSTVKDRLISSTSFETNKWGNEVERQNNEAAHSGSFSEKMEKEEYGLMYKIKSSDLHLNPNEILKAEAWFNATDSLQKPDLVVAYTRNDELIKYNSAPLKNFFQKKNTWTRVIAYSEVPEGDFELSVYIWNPKHESFYADDISVIAEIRNGLYRK